MFSGYRLVNVQGGIFVWKKERKIKYGRRKNRKTEKQKVKEITDKLEEGLKELFESEKYKGYLSFADIEQRPVRVKPCKCPGHGCCGGC